MNEVQVIIKVPEEMRKEFIKALAGSTIIDPNNLVVAEENTAEWVNDSDNIPVCSKCEEIALQRVFVKVPHLIQDVRMVKSKYCPNCGRVMKNGGLQ